MKNTYPIIKFPKDIQNIIDWNPLDEDRPKKPSPPKRPSPVNKPTLPAKPIEPRLEKDGIGCFAIFLAPLIIYMFILANEKSSVFFGTLGWVFIFVFIVLLINNDKKEKKYNVDKSLYPQLVKGWEEECKKLNINYQADVKSQENSYLVDCIYYEDTALLQYNTEVRMFEEYQNTIEAKSEIRSRKMHKIREFLLKSMPVVQYQENKKLTKGVSEQGFYDFLLNKKQKAKKFDPDINTLQFYTDKTVPSCWFLPDIVVKCQLDSQHVIYVDVEIDEPYVGKDGMPIHYIGGGDELRDIYFLNNGWLVIRFAEEQIIKNPDECLKFIQTAIKSASFGRLDLVEEFMNKMDLPIVKRWTKDEAHTMAFRRYRNTYLKKDFVENLSVEEGRGEPEPYKFPTSKWDNDEDVALPF